MLNPIHPHAVHLDESLPVLARSQVNSNFSFTLHARQNAARAGTFVTPHGVIETPVFMPVGTHSTVKSLLFPQIREMGAQIVLANAYHLYLRPGHRLVERAGGLHDWSAWNGPILTDSGGFQVFSLSKLRKITEEGVHFQNPIDGQKHFISPEKSMEIQNSLGADIIMAFDECPPYPVTPETAKASLEMTQRWLARCWAAHARHADQALFPIVQGATFKDLRIRHAQEVQEFNAVGYAIGGVSVGEPRPLIDEITAYTAPLLPENKPRYLMGVGTIRDLLKGIESGVDMFDCVLPTRNARHGTFFTPKGHRHIKNACFTEDFSPLVEGCTCTTCQHHSRAYIRHLMRQNEDSGKTLLSIHNVHTLVQLAKSARQHILAGTFQNFCGETLETLGEGVSVAS